MYLLYTLLLILVNALLFYIDIDRCLFYTSSKEQGQMPRKEQTLTVVVTRHLKLEEKVCPICGMKFVGPKVKVYCTGRGGVCANRANYLKHAAQRRADRRQAYGHQKVTGSRD